MSVSPPAAEQGDAPSIGSGATDLTVADFLSAGEIAASSSQRASRPNGTKGRLLLMAVVLLCLVGPGVYLKWRSARDHRNTEKARAILEADGLAVIESRMEPDDNPSPFQSWSPAKMVRIQPAGFAITDDEMPKIAGISDDLNLVLSACPITNTGLASLEGRSNVRFLTLDRTAVTDEGIKHLRGMNLQALDLSSTRITDVGLAELGQFDFPRLKTIALENTKVTNAGLLKLANFKALEWVSVTGTKVTRDGIRHFKAKLPEATVLD